MRHACPREVLQRRAQVYIGHEDGDVAILKAGKKLELIGEINMGSAMYTTPVAHDGVLYIGTRNMLYAVGKKASR